MKLNKFIFIFLMLVSITGIYSQVDPPSGYTVYYGFRMYGEGDYPTADSVNQNLVEIDAEVYKRAQGLDSIRTALDNYHRWPSGQFENPMQLYPDPFFPQTAFWLDVKNNVSLEIKTAAPLGSSTTRFIVNEYGAVTVGAFDSIGAGEFFVRDIHSRDLFGDNVTLTGSANITGDIIGSGNLYINGSGSIEQSLNLIAGNDEEVQLINNGTNFFIYSPTGGVTTTMFKNPSGSYGTVDAGTYKTSGTTGYLTSALGSPSAATLFVATSSGGSPTTELNSVTLTINGVTRHFLVTE